MAEFTEVSPEVLSIAKELIEQYHQFLESCSIGFVFQKEASESGGKRIFSQTSKCPEKVKPHLSEEIDILVVIALDVWGSISTPRRKALIDHALCHIALSPSGNWTIRNHDIEEFRSIIDRYGLWNEDLFLAKGVLENAVEQISLPIEVEISGKNSKGELIAVKIGDQVNL